jgi:hypothetical protein
MKTQEQSILASRYKSVEIEVFVRVNSIAKHLCCSRPNPACHVTLVRRVRSILVFEIFVLGPHEV